MSKEFTEEQKAIVSQMVADGVKAATDKSAADAKAAEDAKKNAGGSGKGDEGKTAAQEAKETLDAEKNAEAVLSQIQSSVKFNMGVKEFVEKNKSLLPDEAVKILSIVEGKTFKNDNEKANTLRKSFLDSFLEKKENIDVLQGSMVSRAEQYKALAESDKEKRSAEFWDLVEVGVALKQGARKADALNKINGGSAGESSSNNPLEDKILAAAKTKFNNKKS